MTRVLSLYRGMGRLWKILFWLAVVLVFYTLFGFLAAPAIVKAVLIKKLPEALHRQVAIEKIRFNPYALSASIEGFRLDEKEAEGEFVAFDRLFVDLAGLSLFKRALMIQSVSLSGPSINVSRLDKQTFSFSDLIAQEPVEKPTAEESRPFLFSINNIEISEGQIRYQDHPKEAIHEIADLNLAIPSISNLPSDIEVFVEPAFSALVNGAPLSLGGGTKPFVDSLTTEVDIHVTGIDIPSYLAYIPNPTGMTLSSALLDVETRLYYHAAPGTRLSVVGTVTLRELEMVDGEGNSYLRLPLLRVVLADSDLLAKEVRLEELVVESPQIELVRLRDERLLPLALLTPDTADKPAEAAELDGPQDSTAEPLRLSIDRLRLSGGEVVFRDEVLEKPGTIAAREIVLAADGFSTIPESSADLSVSLVLNRAGQVSGNGTLVLDPLQTKIHLDIKAVQLAGFQPYISEYSHVLLGGGAFSLQGELSFAAGEDAPVLHFAGQSAIDGLQTTDSLNGDALVKWSGLRLSEIDLKTNPLEIAIDEISLKDLDAQVLVREDGTLNLATLARGGDAQVQDDEPTIDESSAVAPAPQIRIDKVSLQQGQIAIQDRSIRPVYAARFDRLNGTLSGISSQPGSRASVRLDGRLDQAPVTVTGATNLLSDELFLDLEVAFKDFNLSPLSPYSGKFVGSKIDRGKLNLDLHYKIRGTHLESTNKVLLDQFTLGERVESPDATSLPVGLAIALLKNRRGEIRLDIPVKGELDDPEFRVGKVILQVLVNLISRAATSPFSLLAALIPEGKDLQFIAFEPGQAELTKEADENLGILADVLYDRPGLRMDIAGRADLEIDHQALIESGLQKLIRLEKLRQTGGYQGEDSDDQGIVVSAEEYPGFLRTAYTRALESATENEKAAIREQKPTEPAQEITLMENFLRERMVIGAEDLRLLALKRAQSVQGRLIDSGKVESGRLFVIEPRLSAAGGRTAAQAQTLVELLIK